MEAAAASMVIQYGLTPENVGEWMTRRLDEYARQCAAELERARGA